MAKAKEDMLIVIDAETARMNRKLDKVDRSIGKLSRNTDKRMKRFDKAFARSSKSMAKFGAGLGAALGGRALIGSVKQTLQMMDALAKRADTLGFSTDFFQGLQLGAEEAGVAQATLNSTLTAFVKRVGEARNGMGPLVSGLKIGNAALLESIRVSGSQEDALKLIAEAMKKARNVTEKAAIANAAFSRQGIAMERILNQGADALDRTVQKAKELGITIDETLLRSAEKMANEYGVASMVIDRQFNQALIDMAPHLVTVATLMSRVARGATAMIDSFKTTDELVGARSLVRRMAELEKQRNVIVDRYNRSSESNRVTLFGIELPGQAQLDDREAMLKEINRINDEMLAAHKRYEKLTERRPETAPQIAPFITTTTRAPRAPTEQPKRDIFAEEIKRLDTLQRERALRMDIIGLSESAAERLIAKEGALQRLREAGVTLTSEQRTILEALLNDLERGVAKTQAMESAMDALRQTSSMIGDALSDVFAKFVDDGKIGIDDLKSSLRSLLAQMAKVAFQRGVIDALFGGGSSGSQGAITSALSSVFTPTRASVGTPPALTSRDIVPRGVIKSARRGGAAAGGIITAPITININAQGAYPESVESIKREIAKLDQSLPARTVAAVRDAQSRGSL